MHTYGCVLGVLRGGGGAYLCTGGVEGDVYIPMGVLLAYKLLAYH